MQTLIATFKPLKNKIYITGLILIILSFIACTISFYLVIFGLPVFLIGATLVLISKTKIKIKLFTTILPIVLWLPATYIFLYFYGLTTPKTYLIPSTLEKRFRVIYNEKCGIEPKEKNGRHIIEIPRNGILIIKSKFESGWINHEYFLVDSIGNEIKVGNENFIQEKTTYNPNVSLTGSGVMSGSSLDKSSDIHYSDFIINKDTTNERDNFKESERFDSLTRVLVEKCRKH